MWRIATYSNTAKRLWVHPHLHLAQPPRLLDVTRDGGEKVECGGLFEHVDLIKGHAFLGDEDLLGALHNKVAARVVWALADVVVALLVDVVQETVL